jgi:competence protein ComEA
MKKILLALVAFVASMNFAFAADANSASKAELEAIKGIGPSIADRIIDERKKGGFKDMKDLEERVKGIGEENVKKMAAAGLTVGGGKGAAPKAPAAPAAEVKKDAPKAEAKADGKKDAPKAEVKADAKKDAPKADAPKADALKADPKAEAKAAKAAQAEKDATAKADKAAAAKAEKAAKADKPAAKAADKPAAAKAPDKPAAKDEKKDGAK